MSYLTVNGNSFPDDVTVVLTRNEEHTSFVSSFNRMYRSRYSKSRLYKLEHTDHLHFYRIELIGENFKNWAKEELNWTTGGELIVNYATVRLEYVLPFFPILDSFHKIYNGRLRKSTGKSFYSWHWNNKTIAAYVIETAEVQSILLGEWIL